MDPKEQQIVVDNLLTTYMKSGQGRTILMLHGWGDSAKGLATLQHRLENHFLVLSLDLPGFGSSQLPDKTWGLDEYAGHVERFLNKLGAEPYAIIGHSNGGAIAIRGLSLGLLKSKKLILLSSAGIRDKYKGKVRAIRLVTKAGKILTAPLPNSTKKHLRKKVYSTIGSDMLVAEHLQETFKKVVTDDVQEDASKLTLPTLLVYGKDDTATPPAYGMKLHQRIPGSDLEVIDSAGHFVYLDQSEQVTKLITEFLK